MTLSGGMKRRVLIAKALSARAGGCCFSTSQRLVSTWSFASDMWEMVRQLRASGHDRLSSPRTTSTKPRRWPIASASSTKARSFWSRKRPTLMQKLGKKQLTLDLHTALDTLAADTRRLTALSCRRRWRPACLYLRHAGDRSGIHRTPTPILPPAGIRFKDLEHQPELARGNLREPRQGRQRMNIEAIRRSTSLRDCRARSGRSCRASPRR
jgi:ABC-2 type transport system ATP-binding protein